jgi:hypothetical protein
MQAATALPIGTTGVRIPTPTRGAGIITVSQYGPIYVIFRVPTLNAGTHTVATSDDAGSTWVTASGAIMFTGYEKTNPTAATDVGGWRQIYGPYVEDTWIRMTSSVSQADKGSPTVRVMASV